MSVPRTLVDNNPNKKLNFVSFQCNFFNIFETGEKTTKTFSSKISVRCKYYPFPHFLFCLRDLPMYILIDSSGTSYKACVFFSE